jgi:iron(III) transport system ATP-binding protein
MSDALSFDSVSFSYNGERVVDNVSFSIAEGELVCLLGPSGCGKTTCLRLAAGMEKPDDGTIRLGGEVVSTSAHVAPPETRHIGFLFQEFALFPHLSVYDNICFGLNGMTPTEQKARALELLKEVGLSGFADKFPNSLSGGEQQRAALARALAPSPRLVLMDEPFSNLDPQLRDRMRDLTLRLLKQVGAAGLVVTHDAADALRMADRIAVQADGKILQMDMPETVYRQPTQAEVATMFGTVNFFKTDNGMVGVRPSDISLSGGDGDFSFEGKITDSRSMGAGWLCVIEVENGDSYEAQISGEEAPDKGTHKFFVPQACLMLFKD